MSKSSQGVITVMLFLSCHVCPAAGETLYEDSRVHIYSVNRSVSEYPREENLSTPETTYVVINHTIADGREGDWRRISVKRFANTQPRKGAKPIDVKPETAHKFRNANILEIWVLDERRAKVISELPTQPPTFDCRNLEKENGDWLNGGHGIANSLEQARQWCSTSFSEQVGERRKRPGLKDPEAYLAPFVQFLRQNGKDPKLYVLSLLANYPLVIMGELHHRPRYWAFNQSLVEEPEFARNVGVIYLELPMNDQQHIDRFLAAPELDTGPVIKTLRDIFEMGWPDKPMLDFFVTVWRVNQTLAKEQRIRIVLVDMARPWEEIKRRSDWAACNTDRDKLMADNIIADRRANLDDSRHGFFIVGVGHAMLDLKQTGYPPQYVFPAKSAGWHLANTMGRDSVCAIFQHMPVGTNWGRWDGYASLGLFDTAFAELGTQPVAFPLTTGPFGEQPFDALTDRPLSGAYRDGYDTYLYLGPLETEVFSPLIEGFYTEAFVQEMDRRYRIMVGKPMEETFMGGSTLEDVVKRMSKSWGQPRKKWQFPKLMRTAWYYGDDWQEVIREQEHDEALEHPERVVEMARQLFDAIRDADYERDWSHGDLHNEFIPPTIDYCTQTRYDLWIKWMWETFRDNPVESVTLGNIRKSKSYPWGAPGDLLSFEYLLALHDGKQLKGKLKYEFMSRTATWRAYGLDWHLVENPLEQK